MVEPLVYVEMIRKWEWVRNYCTLHGYEKSAEIADEIDRVLCYLYGDVDINEWMEYVRSASDGIEETGSTRLGVEEVVGVIVCTSSFCIACRESEYVCEGCKFGELVGECMKRGSLYCGFLRCLIDESQTWGVRVLAC